MFATAKLYGALAMGLLVLGLVVFAGWQYDQTKLARKDSEAATLALQQLQAGVVALQAGQQASNESIQTMVDRMNAGTQHAATVRQRVVTMGNNDATVQTWLDTRLPVGGCMLDDTCGNGGASGSTIGSPVAAVPASGAGAVGH